MFPSSVGRHSLRAYQEVRFGRIEGLTQGESLGSRSAQALGMRSERGVPPLVMIFKDNSKIESIGWWQLF